MTKCLLTAEEIAAMPGLDKTHFLNPNARRVNKSLGDLCGMTGLGFHLIEVPPGCESTEYHRHYFEDECVYVLSGTATAIIDGESFLVKAGDFLGYAAGGPAHTLVNTGAEPLRCLVAGQRLGHDVADYPKQHKRIYRNQGLAWDLVPEDAISHPDAGRKV